MANNIAQLLTGTQLEQLHVLVPELASAHRPLPGHPLRPLLPAPLLAARRRSQAVLFFFFLGGGSLQLVDEPLLVVGQLHRPQLYAVWRRKLEEDGLVSKYGGKVEGDIFRRWLGVEMQSKDGIECS